MTMITPSYLGETIEYSSLHACRSTLEDPTGNESRLGRYHWAVVNQQIDHAYVQAEKLQSRCKLFVQVIGFKVGLLETDAQPAAIFLGRLLHCLAILLDSVEAGNAKVVLWLRPACLQPRSVAGPSAAMSTNRHANGRRRECRSPPRASVTSDERGWQKPPLGF